MFSAKLAVNRTLSTPLNERISSKEHSALQGRVEKRGALASNNQPISRFVDILMLPKHCAEGGGVYRLLRSRCDSRWKIERHTSDLHMNQARGTCQVYQVRRDQCVLG
jgi:hypothetical protein